MKSTQSKKFIAISTLSILLSMLTMIFGSPFLRVLRKVFGPAAYWLTGLFIVGAAWLLDAQSLAVFIGSVWMTLGAYSEMEIKGFGWWLSGILSVAVGLGFTGLSIFSAFKLNGVNTLAEGQKYFVEFVAQVQEMNPGIKLDSEVLMQQTPSAIVIMLILAIGVGLIFERRVFSWLKLPHEKIASQLKLLEYRVPEYFIWVAMTAFLLTMVSFGGKAIAILAVNVVNVSVVLYFFQGLAVLEVFLNSMRASALTRVLTHIILVGQMLLLVSIFGLIDYWVDFRGLILRLKTIKDN